jgi:putative tryptophan/tyrosine transport system substrate-binding protein
MKRKITALTLCTLLFALCGSVDAQQAEKIFRIGFLDSSNASGSAVLVDAFRHEMRKLGWTEGKNITIEYRFAEGKPERRPELAADLVRLKVDLIVATDTPSALTAKNVTTTIPIVIVTPGDPVGVGLVASLARPGGNITGLSTLAPELSGKRLELLKETVPRLSRVAAFGTSTSAGNAEELTEVELAAGAFGVKLQYLDVLGPKDFETAFRATSKERADAALMMVSGAIAGDHRAEIAELAVKRRLPVIYQRREHVEAGGLMSYGVNRSDLFRRAASYVDKILKGTKPADIPVEQPIKFDFVINLKAAKQIGLTIPQWTLTKADKVIK